MTDCEMMTKFIEENADIALKFIMWQDLILEPQVFEGEIEAEDIESEIITIQDNGNGTI